MPGPTAFSDALSALERSRNEVNTPTTVPNNPTNGAAEAVVARNVNRFSSVVSCELEIRCITRSSVLVLEAFFSAIDAALLNTGPSGVNLNASTAVRISERLLPFRSEEHTSELQSQSNLV